MTFNQTAKITLGILLALSTGNASAFTISGSGNSDLKGWQVKELTFKMNLASCAGLSQAVMEQAVTDAFDAWNHVSNSSLTLTYGGTTTTTVAAATAGTATDYPVIICDPNFNTTTGNAGDNGVTGVGTFATNAANEITKGYLLLNADTTTSPTNNISTGSTSSLSLLIAHEVGHVLGFGHSSDPFALMYYQYTPARKLALAQDDADALAYLYPRSEPSSGILGCGTLATPPTGGPWTGIGLSLFWYLLVPALVLRASRRFIPRYSNAHP